MTDHCKECDKPARATCYGCVMTLHSDIDKHDVIHDTYGNRGEPRPSYDPWTGQIDE